MLINKINREGNDYLIFEKAEWAEIRNIVGTILRDLQVSIPLKNNIEFNDTQFYLDYRNFVAYMRMLEDVISDKELEDNVLVSVTDCKHIFNKYKDNLA